MNHVVPNRGLDARGFILTRMRVDEATGCWIWTGALSSSGYGSMNRDGYRSAHRYAYHAFVGEIPAGLTLDHLCRNRACCNPSHLEAVTVRINTLRSPTAIPAINARKSACSAGHSFNEINTYIDKQGRRFCRTCRHEAVRRYRNVAA